MKTSVVCLDFLNVKRNASLSTNFSLNIQISSATVSLCQAAKSSKKVSFSKYETQKMSSSEALKNYGTDSSPKTKKSLSSDEKDKFDQNEKISNFYLKLHIKLMLI